MLWVGAAGLPRWVRTVPLVMILAAMAVASFPAAGASSISVPPAPLGVHVVNAPLSASLPTGVARSASTPAEAVPPSTSYLQDRPSFTPTGVHLNFFQNNSTFADLPTSEQGCSSINYTSVIDDVCTPQAVDPSAVTLANGHIGVAYTLTTNVTGTRAASCVTGTTNSTVQERIGWSISSDNGATFGPISFLGNETCSYLDAVEPSFAAGPTGTVYGAYVQENFSGGVAYYTDNFSAGHIYCYTSPCPVYGNRSTDSLGFTTSTNNGGTFSQPITISTAGWIAAPQVAVFGQSVYVLYDNINNYTGTAIPYGYGGSTYYDSSPIELELLYSSNGGATWAGPYTVPGITGVSGIAQEAGGSIAVNSSGTVAVSYFTNDNCYAVYYSFCYGEGDDLVLATSTTNGTSFKGPFTISTEWGSTPYYWAPFYDYNYASNFEELPTSSIAFSPSGSTVYIGFTASYNQTLLFGNVAPYPYYLYEAESGAFEATGSVTGTGFTTNILMATAEFEDEQFAYSIAVGANAGGVYVTYSGYNESYCYVGGGTPCSYIGSSFFQAVQTSPNGLTWSGPAFSTFVQTGGDPYNLENEYPGIDSSVTFTSTGAPVYAYALPDQGSSSVNCATSPCVFSDDYPTNLYVATNYSGPTVSLDIQESGANGAAWSVGVDGSTINVPAGVQNFTLAGIAVNQTVLFDAGQLAVIPGEISSPSIAVTGGHSFEGAATFEGDGNVYVNYTDEYGLTITLEPSNPYESFVESVNCAITCYEVYYEAACTPIPCTGVFPGPMPWYFPSGAVIEFEGEGYPVDAQYWTGIGNGSYNGPGYEANLTMNSPINETVWYIGLAQYNVSVQAPSLPAGSTYSFDFDGTLYSGTAGSSVTVPYVETGSHSLSNAAATSTVAGWSYVGTAGDYQPVLVPNSLTINLTFALVDTSAASGTVTFEAQGFSAGTPWQFSFNGSAYSSDTPWINITSRPGTFLTSASPAVASNGSVGYTPLNVPAEWSVTPGSTYVVNFTQAYRVNSIAGSGGSISGGGASGTLWVQAGGLVALTASAHTGYAFNGWSGIGLGSYTGGGTTANITVGGPITETASFVPLTSARFNLTFVETGLAPGTLWTADVGAIGYSGTGDQIVVGDLLACGSPGANYNISIPTVYVSALQTRYVGTSTIPKTQCTTGSTVVSEKFAPQYFVSVQSTPGGYASATLGSVTTITGFWVPSGGTVGLNAYVQPGYEFLGWNGTGPGNYSGTLEIDTIVVAGPVVEVAAFAIPVVHPPPTYWLEFTLSAPLTAGTSWTVTLQGTGYTSTGATLTIPGLAPQTYQLGYATAYSPDGLTKYTPVGNPTSVSLTTNKSLAIGFTTAYWLTVVAGAGGTIVSPTGSEWVAAGATVTLNATASAGYQFAGWSGGAYAGSSSTQVIVVHGPVTEFASFEPIPSTTSVKSSGGSSFFSQPIAWIGLGVVGLLAGLAIGLLVARRGRSPPPSQPTSLSEEPAAPAPEPEAPLYGADGGSSP
jgi:hypothetical protein